MNHDYGFHGLTLNLGSIKALTNQTLHFSCIFHTNQILHLACRFDPNMGFTGWPSTLDQSRNWQIPLHFSCVCNTTTGITGWPLTLDQSKHCTSHAGSTRLWVLQVDPQLWSNQSTNKSWCTSHASSTLVHSIISHVTGKVKRARI